MIACLEEIDEMETIVSEKKNERKRIIQDIDRQMEQLRQEENAMQQKIAELDKARGNIVDIADPELLKLYEIVKKNIGSFAIAKVREAVCMGCHVNLPPQTFNELLRFDKVFYCPHCERLIYPITSDADDHEKNI
jgi:predicted  nucleic acid-binding Zn-ribbon protein